MQSLNIANDVAMRHLFEFNKIPCINNFFTFLETLLIGPSFTVILNDLLFA